MLTFMLHECLIVKVSVVDVRWVHLGRGRGPSGVVYVLNCGFSVV